MPAPNSTTPSQTDPDFQRFLRLTIALFLSYLCVAMSLPVTSIYVTTELGYGNGLAGLAVGIAFASTILTRNLAGRTADRRGGKHAMIRGLWIYTAAALLTASASTPGLPPALAYAILIAGRLLLGTGESLALIGLLTWCFGIMGPQRSGKVLSLVGMALYGAFTAGGPIGLALYNATGFSGLMAACALMPLIGLALIRSIAAVAPHAGERPAFWRIIGRIWQPGLVVFLQGVGFAAIGAFLPLHFLHEGWSHAGLGISCFGGAFVLVRIVAGHLPDRVGGLPVALVSLAVEAAGQYLLWTAPSPELALAGAFLTGLGCSMMFPAMGLEIVRRVPPHLRGTAMGGFAAFQDLAYGGTGPLTGLLADQFGTGVVFLIGGLAATLGLAIVFTLVRAARLPT